jgi:CubicO group peptidase (beta-lactamase class C family)
MSRLLRVWSVIPLRVAVLVAAVLSGAATVQPDPLLAQRAPVALPAAAITELDTAIAAELEKASVPGASVAIVWKGAVVYSKGFGFADLEARAPATARTAFRTASVAKPLTATGLMRLVEAGTIDLDAPIQRYCPAFPEKPWPVSARQILGHQAGIRHYKKPGESSGTTHYFTIQESLSLFKNDPLEFEPGTKYLYSTYGYSVLGCAIEGASGQPYETYMRDRVFTPAGMTRTRLDRLWEIVPERARGYQLLTAEVLKTLPAPVQSFAKAGEIYNGPLHDTSMKIPGGGLVSTAEDLARFGSAVQSGTVLKRETVEQMWTDGKTRDGAGTGYGLGWGVTPAQEGIRRLTHSGNQVGAASVLHVLPEVSLSYAIMTNLEDTALGPVSRAIANILRAHVMGK